MNLCAQCVANVMNDQYGYAIQGEEHLSYGRERFAEVIEAHANDEPDRPRIVERTERRRVLTFRAVSVVNGVPFCAWCVGERPWTAPQPRPGRHNATQMMGVGYRLMGVGYRL